MNDSLEALIKATKWVRLMAATALGVLALFLLALTISAFGNIGSSDYPTKTITVEGTGKAATIPDIATVDFSVTETAATVTEAQGRATEKTNAALAAVKKLGIDDKDVKTVAYNVYPQYANTPCYGGICPNTNKITGYQVSQSVEVKVRDTAKAGDVLQALGTLEVQGISGPNFMVDDDKDQKSEARAEAIKNARAKAEELAKELGVHLGKVVSYNENGGAYPLYYEGAYGKGGMAMDAQVAPAPSLPTGQAETSVTVSVTFEIR